MKLANTLVTSVGALLLLSAASATFAKDEGKYQCALYFEEGANNQSDRVFAGYFQSCSGLGSENEIIEHKVVDEKGVEFVLKIPGRLRYDDIVLHRGVTSDMQLWDWRQQVVDGDVAGAKRNGSVVMFDEKGSEVAVWNFEKAWPSKVTTPSPEGSGAAIEQITMVHEGIYREM